MAASLSVVAGPVNGALIERAGRALAVYGDPRPAARAEAVLFTHHRRDVVAAGRPLVARGAGAVAPAAEVALFADVAGLWARYAAARYHDYEQRTSKVLAEPLPVGRTVAPGDAFDWADLRFHVLGTPGYTPGAVSYLVELDGRRVAFVGDLVYGDGQILDLYSFQGPIPDAGIRGYHGYAARLADLLTSLEAVGAARPDVLVPARGPVIADPERAMGLLADRVRRLYANYLSTDALRWYFGDDHVRTKAQRVLGPAAAVEWLPLAEIPGEGLPAWVRPLETSRLLVAADRSAFLIDCGSLAVVEELRRLRAAGEIASVDGVWLTHYHDDHVHEVGALVREFGCPAFAVEELRDVLENPADYRLPCLTERPVRPVFGLRDGAELRWKEFALTCRYLPGQTLYHGGLVVRRDAGAGQPTAPLCFVGDSFTPSGLDDYCLPNRNPLREGAGFRRCLDVLDRDYPGCLLVNQHVPPPFRFSAEQTDYMRAALIRRAALVRELTPWDDPDYALDEQWARLHPYSQAVVPGGAAPLSARVRNYSRGPRAFSGTLRFPAALGLDPTPWGPVEVPAGREVDVPIQVRLPASAPPGAHVVTSDVAGGPLGPLDEWAEAILLIQETT